MYGERSWMRLAHGRSRVSVCYAHWGSPLGRVRKACVRDSVRSRNSMDEVQLDNAPVFGRTTRMMAWLVVLGAKELLTIGNFTAFTPLGS